MLKKKKENVYKLQNNKINTKYNKKKNILRAHATMTSAFFKGVWPKNKTLTKKKKNADEKKKR